MVRSSFRKRSVSGGSFTEMNHHPASLSEADDNSNHHQHVTATLRLFDCVLRQHSGTKPCLVHLRRRNPALMTALLDRAEQLDDWTKDHRPQTSAMLQQQQIRKRLLLASDAESGYTALHWGVYDGDLTLILSLLRHALSSRRLTHRPMQLLDMLKGNSSAPSQHYLQPQTHIITNMTLLESMVTARDHEGYTPRDLLASRQRMELWACRRSLPRPRVLQQAQERRRRTSFDISTEEEDEQNELDELSQGLRLSWEEQRAVLPVEEVNEGRTATRYGCEVLTFGKAHHCALGVGNSTDISCTKNVRPQRVQAFEQSLTGRDGGAVAIAAAAHHTLVATADGQIYAFGLGKGGRLGLGDQVTHCPTPTRITGGSLSQRKVVGIAAAENHSIAVTSCGLVFTWGSNRFGQLSDDGTSRSVPRRVEDLKTSFCVAVAAGERHSVALSQQGEVFVWGTNTAGQLGISRRNGTHRVQRVESLWNCAVPKVAIAVEASEEATLVLTRPSGKNGIPVNTIYSWGHGSHVPTRIVFAPSGRMVNPVAIACARYHNVAVSSDGLVYSWGLHAEPLGVVHQHPSSTTSKRSSASSMISSPQLVNGMLPEKGGGRAVAVSASENHTAVLTDTGAMYTWGASSKNVMGHAGVRWQPDPKQVPGVSRAVAVAAAKEHTVFLMGASFPPLPLLVQNPQVPHSLEAFASRTVAGCIDLFNAVPLLIFAERTCSTLLIEYCTEFCRRNLDGILTVAQRSVLDTFLNEQLRSYPLEADGVERDQPYHPVLEDLLFAGSELGPFGTVRALCDKKDWASACEALSRAEKVRVLFERIEERLQTTARSSVTNAGQRVRSLSDAGSKLEGGLSCPSDRCLELTTNMDLATEDLASRQVLLLTKELRGVNKRLGQIKKLENSPEACLSEEQREKVARRPQLEADLCILGPALQKAEQTVQQFAQSKEKQMADSPTAEKAITTEELSTKDESLPNEDSRTVHASKKTLRCEVCGITCPDEVSYTMHMNGRKHRNRVAQVEQNEQAKAAAAMMAARIHQDMLKSPDRPQEAKSKVAWKKSTKRTLPLPCKLPPPPHGAPDSLVTGAPSAKPTLMQIMAEEQRKSSASQVPAVDTPTKRGNKSISGSPACAPAAGVVPPLKVSSTWASPSEKSSKPQSSPFVVRGRPVSSPSSASARTPTSSAAFSLADFVQKPAPPTTPQKSVGSPWMKKPTTQTVKISPVSTGKTNTNTVRFADIQRQELASKQTEVQTFHTTNGETNKWYLERRQRTGSLLEIQDQASKERENELLVEEQFRIEKMIAEENQRRRKEEARHRKAKQKKPKKSEGKKTKPKGDEKRFQGSRTMNKNRPKQAE